MENTQFSQVCPVCGVRNNPKTGEFLFHSGDKPSANKVYDRVCNFAISRGRKGCINTNHTSDGSEGWYDWSDK